MPACFTEWTVLPHGPITKKSENLWTVDGTLPKGKSPRQMTVVKLGDGRLLIHNAIALNEEDMQELERFGTVAAILVPNGFHRQDAFIWKQRYTSAKVYCPKKATKKVAKVVSVDGTFDEVPGDDRVSTTHVAGVGQMEGVVTVRSDSGSTLVFNDVILNVPKSSGVMGFMLSPSGRPSVPRIMRWMALEDKRAFGEHLQRLSKEANLTRILVGHGAPIEEDAPRVLGSVATEFGRLS